jgi:hypothetical protein
MKRMFRTLLCLGVLSVASQAAIITYSGILGPEAAGATGSGSALVTYDNVARTLVVDVSFAGLSGNTTVAHIHCCVDPPGTAGVATYPGTFPGFPVGIQAGSYLSPSPIDLALTASYTAAFLTAGGGTADGAEALLINSLDIGRAYLNIHTSAFPPGEIRAFLTPIPEPGTTALLGCGLAALAAFQIRRKKR